MVTKLVKANSGRVAWSESPKSTAREIMPGEDKITAEVVLQLGTHMRQVDILRAVHRPAPIKKETARATSG